MKSTKLGILSAITASICCIGPLILIVLGLGSLGFGAVIGKFHWLFLAVGIALILFSWTKYFKEKKRCDIKKCQMENKQITLITLIIATIIVLFFAALNLYTYAGKRAISDSDPPVAGLETAVIPVKGMTCFTCEVSVSTALKRVDGVVGVEASAKERIVRVSYDPAKTDINQLTNAIEGAGYEASLPR